MIRVDGSEVRAFSEQLREFPREARTQLRREIRKQGKELVDQVKQNASWSDRIPGAVKMSVGFTGRRSGVRVFVDRKKAPHARPLEFGNRGAANINRHPVFGGDTWVDQPTRPFFIRAVNAQEQAVVAGVQSAIDSAFRRI